MSQRSKRETTTRRCKVCGCVSYQFKGVRSDPCPYKALHQAPEQEG